MLATVGIFATEMGWHPMFGGHINVPAYRAFQATPLQDMWPLVLLAIGMLEVPSLTSFERLGDGGQPWSIRPDHYPGDMGFDPLNLEPDNPRDLERMQTQELNNGRLAMIAVAGMIAQELVTHHKVFPLH
jgi:hypothetical protein